MSMKDWAAREVEIACKRETPDRRELLEKREAEARENQ